MQIAVCRRHQSQAVMAGSLRGYLGQPQRVARTDGRVAAQDVQRRPRLQLLVSPTTVTPETPAGMVRQCLRSAAFVR